MIKPRQSLADSPSHRLVQWRFVVLSSLFFIAATLIFIVTFSALRINALKAEQATTASVIISQLTSIVEKTEEPGLDELVKSFLAIQVGIRVFNCINLRIDSMDRDYSWPSKNCLDFQDRESPGLQATSSRSDDPSARFTITAIMDEDAPIHQYAGEAIQITLSALVMGLFALLAVNFAFNRAVRQPLKNLLYDLLGALTGYEGESANSSQKASAITQFASSYEAMFERARELKRKEAFWRTIVDGSFDCIITADSEGRIIDFNPAAEKTFGYQRDRILGLQIQDLMVPKRYQAALNEWWARFLITGESHTIGKILKTEALKSDGTEIFVEISIATIKLESEMYFTIYLRDVTETKRTLDALVESEAMLTQSAEIAHLGYAVWDDTLDRDITVSEELARIHGLTRDEYLETISSMEKYLEFVIPEDREKYMDYENQFGADDSGEAASIEYRITRSDGEIRHLIQRSQYVPVSSGKPTQSIVVIQDITDQRRVEFRLKKSRKALEESEAMLTQSAEMANLGHAIWSYAGDKYITVSEKWADIHGYTQEEYLTKFIDLEKDTKLIHPADRERYHDYYENIEEVPEIEYRIIRRDGITRFLLERHQHLFNESGEPTKSLVTIQDITEQKQVEFSLKKSRQALEEREAMLSESAEMVKLGHAVWDNDCKKYISISEGWADIFGYKKKEFLATFTSEEKDIKLVHPADRDRYLDWDTNYDISEEVPDIEYRIVRRDGKIRYLLERHKFVVNEISKLPKSFLTIQDITDHIERENELSEAKTAAEQASVAKSSFLAMISHEIRTPLNAVLGSLGLIDSKELDPSLRKFLDTGRKGAESLLHIVNDVLDFSKIEAGKLQLEPAPFNVRKSIDDVLQVLEQQALERNISLTGDSAPDVPEFLVGDASRIRQVLLNLCSNAVRFTTKGGVHISLSTPRLQDKVTHVRFQVEDTGCGVPLEDHEHLFEEFWGTSSTTLGNAGNTGLGLPISKQLVEIMDGSIGFESEPHRGSIFWFELPLKIPSEEVVKLEKDKSINLQQVAPYANLPLLQGRVLLAEDNPANQLIGQTVLERIGLRVDVVSNGHEVIAALRSAPYDVVLMDINMPEMDGIEATEAIRKLPGASSSIPVIAMTALAMPGDREKFLSQGMDGYVSKPIVREELYACIERILKGLDLLPAATHSPNDVNQADTDAQIVDAKILGVLMADVGADLLPKIIDTYLSEVPARVDAITAAAACGNCELVAKEAHPLKSSSANLGAMGLSELASQLEHAGLQHELEKIALGVLNLPSLFEQTREELLAIRRDTTESDTSSRA